MNHKNIYSIVLILFLGTSVVAQGDPCEHLLDSDLNGSIVLPDGKSWCDVAQETGSAYAKCKCKQSSATETSKGKMQAEIDNMYAQRDALIDKANKAKRNAYQISLTDDDSNFDTKKQAKIAFLEEYIGYNEQVIGLLKEMNQRFGMNNNVNATEQDVAHKRAEINRLHEKEQSKTHTLSIVSDKTAHTSSGQSDGYTENNQSQESIYQKRQREAQQAEREREAQRKSREAEVQRRVAVNQRQYEQTMANKQQASNYISGAFESQYQNIRNTQERKWQEIERQQERGRREREESFNRLGEKLKAVDKILLDAINSSSNVIFYDEMLDNITIDANQIVFKMEVSYRTSIRSRKTGQYENKLYLSDIKAQIIHGYIKMVDKACLSASKKLGLTYESDSYNKYNSRTAIVASTSKKDLEKFKNNLKKAINPYVSYMSTDMAFNDFSSEKKKNILGDAYSEILYNRLLNIYQTQEDYCLAIYSAYYKASKKKSDYSKDIEQIKKSFRKLFGDDPQFWKKLEYIKQVIDNGKTTLELFNVYFYDKQGTPITDNNGTLLNTKDGIIDFYFKDGTHYSQKYFENRQLKKIMYAIPNPNNYEVRTKLGEGITLKEYYDEYPEIILNNQYYISDKSNIIFSYIKGDVGNITIYNENKLVINEPLKTMTVIETHPNGMLKRIEFTTREEEKHYIELDSLGMIGNTSFTLNN
ncbi:CCDC34 family protein [Mesonia aquimarina]|uniref:hypothetical protein n=1 Tax=Mesonia aquimarina TaxID=1504967 RepID=UPI000EF5BC00|nr:hypothetical protein [Mesonia aquimarina]